MELTINNQLENQIINDNEVILGSTGNFIEANTMKVELDHLKNECIIPVFAKDNESTLSHYQFISKTKEVIQDLFPGMEVSSPNIRVSHIIKGRIPSAVGKPVKELLDSDKTLYYERCAFIIELPQIKARVNNNDLTLSIGGVRAYNQENLYSSKSPEKFKFFIGFKNMVCTNLCVSTDGLANNIRVNSINQLADEVENLLSTYDQEKQLISMQQMKEHKLDESQFAHFIGKLRMFQHLNKADQKHIFPVVFNDSQINSVVKNYYNDNHFKRCENGSIDLWSLYNLFTDANKSSYIDHNLERNVNAYELINNLVESIKNRSQNWLLHN